MHEVKSSCCARCACAQATTEWRERMFQLDIAQDRQEQDGVRQVRSLAPAPALTSLLLFCPLFGSIAWVGMTQGSGQSGAPSGSVFRGGEEAGRACVTGVCSSVVALA